ncbi:murein biosynthesis integral membrane protein MurJ [Maricaulis virginensis]|uniref:Probable lipid II flippase MurJ n=1 Tax=Maricaulis virginensis TaxID=144022 RepID=A0A9W6INM8_9PROT|nr:murein biosynthesis integral membrane protein MurJ [Maricaulis virginensis]GLK53643.1 putative lipid II flippase MurJ [Maricaulis virginensis]
MRLLRSSAVVGALTMVSRVLGFVRDMLLAAALGTGPVSEAFVVALRFPNLFRRLFAEGAFNAAFVPLYAGKVEAEGQEEAQLFLKQVLSVLITVLAVFVVLAQVLMPWLMMAIVPGFEIGEPGRRYELAVLFTQITMPYIFLMSITAMLGGVLNSHNRFVVAAAAPVILNVVLIAVLATAPDTAQVTGLRLSFGVTVSGILQALFLFWGCRRLGIRFGLTLPRLTPGVKRLIALGIPGTFAAGITQINIIISQQIASLQDGAVALLYFADRLYQLPLGVIGIAMGVALLPTLSRRMRAEDHDGARNAMNRALEMSMALTVPAAIAMIVMPNFLVEGLFMRGEFSDQAARGTAFAVQAFAVGLPAFVLIKVFSPGFFAREDTKTPMRFAALSMLVNVAVGLGLFFLIRNRFPEFGHVGLAAATSLAGWLNAILLMLTLRRRGGLDFDARLKSRLPRVAVAATMMGLAIAALASQSETITALALGSQLLALVLVSGAGLGVFGLVSIMTGALRPSEVLQALGRR